ncbi:MAG: DUF3552 domain-containing protein, partial [Clostridia bacterium]|nr:DUF3552 domain-containing protein [Clostridia bacterium]
MLQNSTFLLLSSNVVLGAIIAGVVGLIVGAVIVYILLNVIRNGKIAKTNKIIEKMKADAENECKALKKEAIFEAKEQELKLRTDFERESKEKRAELQRMEQRLNQKDETLNKKDANLLRRTEEVEDLAKNLEKKQREADVLVEKLETQHELFVEELEKVAQMTQEEAKTMIIEDVKEEARKEASIYVRNQEQQAK